MWLVTLRYVSCFIICFQGYSRTRDLDSDELLEQLPGLQQLLYRLIGCRVFSEPLWLSFFDYKHFVLKFDRLLHIMNLSFYESLLVNYFLLSFIDLQPEGAAMSNYVIQYALALVCFLSSPSWLPPPFLYP